MGNMTLLQFPAPTCRELLYQPLILGYFLGYENKNRTAITCSAVLRGERGIRTPGTLPFNSFQDYRHRPLGQLSWVGTANLGKIPYCAKFSEFLYLLRYGLLFKRIRGIHRGEVLAAGCRERAPDDGGVCAPYGGEGPGIHRRGRAAAGAGADHRQAAAGGRKARTLSGQQALCHHA